MSELNHYSPEALEKLNGFKRFLVILLAFVGVLLFVFYNLPAWVEPIVYQVDESQAVEAVKENTELKKQLEQLTQENKRIAKQAEFYKKKSAKVSLTAGAKEIFIPDLILNYQSWQDWQKENQGRTFADFREAERKHLKQQLQVAHEVLNQIKQQK